MEAHNGTRPKVLVLTHNYPRYDGDMSGVFIKHLVDGLSRDFDITVIAPHDAGLPESTTDENIRIERFRYGSDDREILAYRGEMQAHLTTKPLRVIRFFRAFRKRAAQLVEKEGYDIVWSHWWIPAGWIASRVIDRGTRLLVTCHGTDVFLLGKNAIARMIGTPVFRRADRVSVVSSFLKGELSRSIGANVPGFTDKTEVLPMPVNSDVFHSVDRAERKPGLIITASRLTDQKRLDVLICAVERLIADGIDVSVKIFGDGPARVNIHGLILSKGLSERVRIHEPVGQETLAERYRRSEIAVLVSEREGFGLTLPEAMLCGCAAVGARSGGITDIITKDGENGLLVEPGNVDSLYGTLRMLLTDREKLAHLQHRGMESAKERFSRSVTVDSFRDLLNRLRKIERTS